MRAPINVQLLTLEIVRVYLRLRFFPLTPHQQLVYLFNQNLKTFESEFVGVYGKIRQHILYFYIKDISFFFCFLKTFRWQTNREKHVLMFDLKEEENFQLEVCLPIYDTLSALVYISSQALIKLIGQASKKVSKNIHTFT